VPVIAFDVNETLLDIQGLDPLLGGAHGWDIAGALAAGCRAAFVHRQGSALIPLGPQPGIVGQDLIDVAEQIVRAGG